MPKNTSAIAPIEADSRRSRNAVDQQHQARDGQQHAHVVDPAGPAVTGLRHQDRGQDRADGGHRHVDQEDRTPPEVVEQQAAEHRAGGDTEADRHGPQADGAGALGRFEDVGDDRQRLRHDRGAAEAHRGPREDQLLGRLCVGREQ